MVGGEALRARLDAMIKTTENLEPTLLRAGLVPLKAAQDRIDAGGPGWAPNSTGTPLLHATGRLLSSLTVGGAGNTSSVSGATVTVGTNVNYATWLQNGTGIYGASGSPITAKDGGPLVFQLGPAKIFAKSVKGVRPRAFLYIDKDVATGVRRVFAAALGFEEVGD